MSQDGPGKTTMSPSDIARYDQGWAEAKKSHQALVHYWRSNRDRDLAGGVPLSLAVCYLIQNLAEWVSETDPDEVAVALAVGIVHAPGDE